MEVIKSTVKFIITDEEKDVLLKAKDVLSGFYDGLRDKGSLLEDTICGYDPGDIDMAVNIMINIVKRANSNPFNEVETDK